MGVCYRDEIADGYWLQRRDRRWVLVPDLIVDEDHKGAAAHSVLAARFPGKSIDLVWMQICRMCGQASHIDLDPRQRSTWPDRSVFLRRCAEVSAPSSALTCSCSGKRGCGILAWL